MGGWQQIACGTNGNSLNQACTKSETHKKNIHVVLRDMRCHPINEKTTTPNNKKHTKNNDIYPKPWLFSASPLLSPHSFHCPCLLRPTERFQPQPVGQHVIGWDGKVFWAKNLLQIFGEITQILSKNSLCISTLLQITEPRDPSQASGFLPTSSSLGVDASWICFRHDKGAKLQISNPKAFWIKMVDDFDAPKVSPLPIWAWDLDLADLSFFWAWRRSNNGGMHFVTWLAS